MAKPKKLSKATQDFMDANDQSPVVEGHVLYKGGGRYKLADGSWHVLKKSECEELPEPYPKWINGR